MSAIVGIIIIVIVVERSLSININIRLLPSLVLKTIIILI